MKAFTQHVFTPYCHDKALFVDRFETKYGSDYMFDNSDIHVDIHTSLLPVMKTCYHKADDPDLLELVKIANHYSHHTFEIITVETVQTITT